MLQLLMNELGLEKYVHLTGAVLNVNEYYSAFDVFAFPSLREGTPLALLEAQANGLPCIISDTIPQDAIATDLVIQLSLDDKKSWIEQLSKAGRKNPIAYSEIMKKTDFDAHMAYQKLFKLFQGE